MRSRLIVILLALSSPLAWAQTKPKMVVMPLQPMRGIDKDMATLLTEMLTTQAGNLGKYEVMSANDVQALLGLEKMKDAVGCDDIACAAQIGGALGAEFLLTGTLGKLAGQLVVSFSLYDSREMKVVRRAQVSVEDREALYANGIATALLQALGLTVGPSSGTSPSDTAIVTQAKNLRNPPLSSQDCPTGTVFVPGDRVLSARCDRVPTPKPLEPPPPSGPADCPPGSQFKPANAILAARCEWPKSPRPGSGVMPPCPSGQRYLPRSSRGPAKCVPAGT
jgi:TolB-like protein